MFEYIRKTFDYINTVIKSIDDNRDPFEAGDLVEVREEVEYVDIPNNIGLATILNSQQPMGVIQCSQPIKKDTKESEIQLPPPIINSKPKAKPIISGNYTKLKGEKVVEWRKRIIPKYNELKHVNYNPDSKYYTTDILNKFIKEIEEIETKNVLESKNQSDSRKEWVIKYKAKLYKDYKNRIITNHPKKDMLWFTETEYNELREIYRFQENEDYIKLGISGPNNWELIDKQDPEYEIENGFNDIYEI